MKAGRTMNESPKNLWKSPRRPIKDEAERSYFKHLPTSFKLPSDAVDKLRNTARKILSESKEYRQFLDDLGREQAGNASGQWTETK